MAKFNTTTVTRKININQANPAPNQKNVQTSVEYETVSYYPDNSADYFSIFLLIAIVVVGIICFIFAIRSRKYYKCPVCGESFRAEFMKAKRCKVCGAELDETDDKNVTDKTK